MEKGLLSLLSDLKDRKPNLPNPADGTRISPYLSHSDVPSASFTPLLPQRLWSKDASEEPDFAEKNAFSTKGIPPLQQETKHGTITITKDGLLQLHLPSVSSNKFSITADSKQITVSDQGRLVWKGTINELPWRWMRIYRYASRFVRICRARIPRLSVEMDCVRGRVMLNGEFEAWNSREGFLIKLLPDEGRVKVFAITDDLEKLRWEGDLEGIPNKFKRTLESSVKLYKRCLTIFEGDAEKLEGESQETALCVPGVGWCSIRGNRYQFFFEDGVQMDINREGPGEILYRDAYGREKQKWLLRDIERLPRHVKARIEKIGVFRGVE
jgi:hypothetical protein